MKLLMRRTRWQSLFFLILLLLTLSACGTPEENNVEAEEGEAAETISDLKLAVFVGGVRRTICIWHSGAEDIFYFFLPSGATSKEIFFENGGGRVLLGKDIKCGSSTDLSSCIQTNVEYELTYVPPEGEELTQTVIFLAASGQNTIFLDTESGNIDYISEDKSHEETGSFLAIGKDEKVIYNGDLEWVRTRGNGSFWAEKKSFELKLTSKCGLFGLPSAKKWILLAKSNDITKLRDQLANDYAKNHTNVATLECCYTDVYINGIYAGLYLLSEKKEAKQLGMLDLEEWNEKINETSGLEEMGQYVSEDGSICAFEGWKNPSDITGGYLLEILYPEAEVDEYSCAFRTNRGYCYRVVSPNNATVEQVTYIKTLFDEMEEAIYSKDGINPKTRKSYADYLDMDSWVNSYLIRAGFYDPDAPYISSYFMKNVDSVDERIQVGPLWDMDKAFGKNVDNPSRYQADPEFYRNSLVYEDALLQKDEVMDAVKQVFEEIWLPYVDGELESRIADFRKQMGDSYALDLIRWRNHQEDHGFYQNTDYDIEYISKFLSIRAEFLKSLWLNEDQWHKVTFYGYADDQLATYMVREGDVLKYVPEPQCFIALFAGWSLSGQYIGRIQEDIRVFDDMEFKACWVDVPDIFDGSYKEKEDVLQMLSEGIDLEELEVLIEDVRRLQEEE